MNPGLRRLTTSRRSDSSMELFLVILSLNHPVEGLSTECRERIGALGQASLESRQRDVQRAARLAST